MTGRTSDGTGRRGLLRRVGGPIAVVAALVLSACTATPTPEPSTASPTPEPVIADSTTIRTLVESPAESPVLTVGGPIEPLAGESAVEVTYPSGGLTVAGVVRTPAGLDEPAPVVVVVHGSVNPDRYDPGTDLVAEQRALLDAGYVVFALDLRGYAGSDAADASANPVVDPGFGWSTVLDWGMALDVVNGLRLADDGQIPGTDPEQVGLVGHSLGGLLAIDAAVIAPGLSQLVVALSAPLTDFSAAAELLEESGASSSESPLPAPDDPYWADISPATFFDRATEPLLLIHGSADDTTYPEWSTETAEAWRAAGNDAEAIIVEGADHALSPSRQEVAGMVVDAFDTVFDRG